MDESLQTLLERHEARIINEMSALYERLAPLERELADVRKAKASLTRETDPQLRLIIPSIAEGSTTVGGIPWASTGISPYRQHTIKQLVRKALAEHFPSGATANDLIDFFAKAWGRDDISRTSLSPQLSRLKSEGAISVHRRVWKLASRELERMQSMEFEKVPLSMRAAPP